MRHFYRKNAPVLSSMLASLLLFVGGFPILSDPEKRMTKDYGVLMAAGFARRWTYYIDVDGTILKIDKETKPATAGRDLTRTMEELGFPRI